MANTGKKNFTGVPFGSNLYMVNPRYHNNFSTITYNGSTYPIKNILNLDKDNNAIEVEYDFNGNPMKEWITPAKNFWATNIPTDNQASIQQTGYTDDLMEKALLNNSMEGMTISQRQEYLNDYEKGKTRAQMMATRGIGTGTFTGGELQPMTNYRSSIWDYKAPSIKGPAEDIDKVMLGTLGLGIAPVAIPEVATALSTMSIPFEQTIANTLANPYVQAGLTSAFAAGAAQEMPHTLQNTSAAREEFMQHPSWYTGLNYAGELGKLGLDASMFASPTKALVTGSKELVNGVRGLYNDIWDNAARMGSDYAAGRQIGRALNENIGNTRFTIGEPTGGVVRTKLGDVEIDNPALAYRQGNTAMGDDFINTDEVKLPMKSHFKNPIFNQGSLFYKSPIEGFSSFSEHPKSDLLVSTAKMLPSDNHGFPIPAIRTEANGDMLDALGFTFFDGLRIPAGKGAANSTNTYLYRWDPNYGYRKVTQEPPTIDWPTSLAKGEVVTDTPAGGGILKGYDINSVPSLTRVPTDSFGYPVSDTAIPYTGTLEKPKVDWTGWEKYRQQHYDKIMEDWNNNGPLRSHLERSGITNPEIALDYVMSPKELARIIQRESLDDYNFATTKFFRDYVKSNPEYAKKYIDNVVDAVENEFGFKLNLNTQTLLKGLMKRKNMEDLMSDIRDAVSARLKRSGMSEWDVLDAMYNGYVKDGKVISFDNAIDAVRNSALKDSDLENKFIEYLYTSPEFFGHPYKAVAAPWDYGLIHVPLNADNYGAAFSHEFGHLEDLGDAAKYGVVESTQNNYAASTKSPLFKKAFNLSKLSKDMRDYFTGKNGDKEGNLTEMVQRATQLKDFDRLSKGQKITGKRLKELATEYLKSGMLDNNMTEFFSTIKDYEAAAEWINRFGKAIIPSLIGAGTAYGLSNNDSNVQALGGPLVRMANIFDDGGYKYYMKPSDVGYYAPEVRVTPSGNGPAAILENGDYGVTAGTLNYMGVPIYEEGKELNDNQYRTQPTNAEASHLADDMVSATEFKPWNILPLPIGEALDKIANLSKYTQAYVSNRLGEGKDEIIDLSDSNVSRITSNTPNISSILGNEFLEKNANTVRTKKEFENTTDTLLGDKNIPLSKVTTFYGIEDGKLKAGPLDIFKENTYVVPNRAPYVGKITGFYPGKAPSAEARKAFREQYREGLHKYVEDHGYSGLGASFWGPLKAIQNNEGRKRMSEVKDSIKNEYAYMLDGRPASVITENGDTINGYNINATPKTFFTDEEGNAIFVSNPSKSLEQLNEMLKASPRYPIMIDNGRYSHYQTENPNIDSYVGLANPNDMYIIGTTKAQGGPLIEMANKYEMGGPKRKRKNTTKPTGLTPWPALSNIEYQAIADPTFTRDKTGEGSIEYFAPNEKGIQYNNGYYREHPMFGHNVILYNPNTNDEQNIRLDALHAMPQDPTYDVLNTIYRNRVQDSDVAYNALRRYKEAEDILEKQGQLGKDVNPDPYPFFLNNEADGLLRNLLIEGTPEYMDSKRYYPDKQQLREWNAPLMPYVDAIQQYLETNERPQNVLEEVVVEGNKHSEGGSLNTYKKWEDLSMKERGEMIRVAVRNGITNLSDIKSKYNEFAEGGNLYGGTTQKTQQMQRGSWKTSHQQRWFAFLKRKGLSDADAARLSGFFMAQDGLESAGGTSSAARQKNNYGGMQRNGKNISYPSVEAYMEDKWNMMNSKFRSALGARTIDEYATILGNPNTAGKGYLYYVTDQAKYDPNSPVWRAAQTKHMHNYINGMRSWAGQGSVKFNDNNYSYNQNTWPQGYVYDVLPQLFAMDGVPITVSSGYRPGAVVNGTNTPSKHGMNQAADIVGDFAKIQQVLDNPNSNVSRWMLANGYGYLNETSGPGGTTKYWKDHNKDHSHYHIGMDSSLAKQYAERFNSMPSQYYAQSQGMIVPPLTPYNQEAFYNQDNTSNNQALIDMMNSIQDQYNAYQEDVRRKELAQQEAAIKQQRMQGLSTLLSMFGSMNQDEGTSPFNYMANMLTMMPNA